MTDKFQKLIGDEIISDSLIDREKFSLAGETPTIVIFPTAIAHISKIMTFANRERIKILISGNNSQHYFGSAIETPDWCISLNRLNKIIEHEVVDLIITVEAGVTFSQLQKFLTVYRQFLPLDPINTNQRTLGGIVATNSAGPLRLQYGSCRDLILGLKVVLPDGTIIRTGGKTVKNVAGYDLSKLFIGSMGTLGVITEITFKLSPR
ncbi:MAG: FAD-binding oxidoreductase, partial [bacterium]